MPSGDRSVAPRRSLGQHFLHDQAVLARIAALAKPSDGSGVVEIGPGTGALTAHLVAAGWPLVVIERDDRLPELLAARFGDALHIVHADATQLDWPGLIAHPTLGPRPVVVGNLPYNVGAAILMRVLELGDRVDRVVVMLQREVAERICSSVGTSKWGLLGVHSQWRAEVKLAFRVGPGAFRPPPKVESAVVVLKPRREPPFPIADQRRFDRLLAAGFGQRRKTLARALNNGIGVELAAVHDALRALGLPADARAERLDLSAWAALAHALDDALIAQAGTARRLPTRDARRLDPSVDDETHDSGLD